MKFEDWTREPFLRDLGEEIKIKEVTKAVHDYFNYRNIEQSLDQKKYIINYILDNLKSFPFAKTSFISWSMMKFADPKNNNISASLFYSVMGVAYKSELYRSIVNQYQKSIEQNMISQETEESKAERNRIARKESFEKISQLVNEGKIDYNHVLWLNTINYIINDLKYRPDKELILKFNELAIKHVTKDLKVIHADDNSEKDERKRAFQFLAEILTNEIETPELKSLIVLQRRKMICEDYIFDTSVARLSNER